VSDLTTRLNDLLAKVPADQRQAAATLAAQYGPQLFAMAQEDALAYLRRLWAGDLDAAMELDLKLSDDAFIAKVKANSARWEGVARYNVVREQLRNEMLLKIAPVIAAILAALVGL